MTLRALEILKPDPDRQTSVISQSFPYMTGGLFCAGVVTFANLGLRRPAFAGIQKHIAAFIAGAAVGKTIDGWRDEHLAERDAVLRHYVELHPEDFPDPERKKFSEVLLPWVPIR